MKPHQAAGEFEPTLGPLLEPALAGLAARLGSIPGLDDAERNAVRAGTAAALHEAVRLKVSRVLVVELNAARITGTLTAPDSAARFQEWLVTAARPGFWDSLTEHYPPLLTRLAAVIDNRCAAAVMLARRFAADRAALGGLLGTDPGAMAAVEFGAGDSHRGGQTVAILRCAGGRVVYKPRSVAVDAALARFLATVLPDEPPATRIRVPDVLVHNDYGWAEHVEHRYCAGEAELRAFYRGVGHWLAVMRLLGGSDLHAENLIAVGPVPTVVDSETLFTPMHEAVEPSGYGLAVDRAAMLVGGSVLRTGLLPGRGLALGWRGVDSSAVGSLPGQQPAAPIPVIVDAGTDLARVELVRAPIAMAANHPTEDPVLGKHWQRLHAGFVELTDRLLAIDRSGGLTSMLAEFADLPIRVVLRATETYAELGRMLWHPVSLHDEASARRRAADLLVMQADNLPGAPSGPAVIDAEIAELLHGDVPFFATTPRHGVLAGPGDSTWGEHKDLIADALHRWRDNDLTMDRQVIQAALVSAYLNEGWMPDERRLLAAEVRTHDLDRRRRTQAAEIMRSLAGAALSAEDGTVTWIAPVLKATGWIVQPLSPDVYGGANGVAVLLSAYLGEVRHGRADPVPELEPLLAAVLRTMRAAEGQSTKDNTGELPMRPEPAGGYIGLGSRIWSWLLLHRLGAVGTEAISRASTLAEHLDGAGLADDQYDVLVGAAGAVVPLLRLAQATGDDSWTGVAGRIGHRLIGVAKHGDGTACWPNTAFPQGVGGFAHGATGIGWALARLATATGERAFAECAGAAFDYEETLYDADGGGWRDLRTPGVIAAAWCHGGGGVGIAAADLLTGADRDWRDVLRRAAASCWELGMGWNHTLCHGDLGSWEVLDHALAAGVGPPGLDRATLDARVLSSLEEHGPISGLARDTFSPGLLPGLGGMAYQLLRMHPDCRLPSVLLPDPVSGVVEDGPAQWRNRTAQPEETSRGAPQYAAGGDRQPLVAGRLTEVYQRRAGAGLTSSVSRWGRGRGSIGDTRHRRRCAGSRACWRGPAASPSSADRCARW